MTEIISRRVWPIYTVGFLFNVTFALTFVIIPLYGLSVGFSATQIGVLLSIPGLLQVVLRLFTGLFSDRYGEKKMLAFTCFLTVAAGLISSSSLDLMTLAFFQIIMGTSRAIFWPTSQSYASRVSNKESSSVLGKFHSATETGKIFGIMFAGWAITNIGYMRTFNFIAIIGVLGLFFVWFMPSLPRAGGEGDPMHNLGSSFRSLITHPPIQFALATAYCAGILVALSQSFVPIWLKSLGNHEGLISIILTANIAGSILAGRFYAGAQKRISFPMLLQLSIGGVGTGFLLISLVKGLWSVFVLVLALGFFTGIIAVSYQVIVVRNSTESNRGLVLSFVGLGWGTAFLTGPALFGLAVDSLTISAAFSWLGLLLLFYSMAVKITYGRFMAVDVGSNDQISRMS